MNRIEVATQLKVGRAAELLAEGSLKYQKRMLDGLLKGIAFRGSFLARVSGNLTLVVKAAGIEKI